MGSRTLCRGPPPTVNRINSSVISIHANLSHGDYGSKRLERRESPSHIDGCMLLRVPLLLLFI